VRRKRRAGCESRDLKNEKRGAGGKEGEGRTYEFDGDRLRVEEVGSFEMESVPRSALEVLRRYKDW